MTVEHAGKRYAVRLPLVGDFQVENALVAAGLAIATGSDAGAVFAALESLKGAKGRLELVGERDGAPIFVDYAHKPDALAKALDALRPYATRPARRGVRRRRRPRRRQAAADGRHRRRKADRVIVTDDNPRSEDPAAIRAAILAAAPGADSRSATAARPSARPSPNLRRGDVLLIAGKGHETGQIVGDQMLPFSDHEAVAAALKEKVGMSERRCGRVDGRWPHGRWARERAPARCRDDRAGISIDSRTIAPGEAFFAIKGDNRDGHDFVAGGAEGRRRPRRRRRRPARAMSPDAPLLVVPDVLDGLRDLARGRARALARRR